MRSVGVQAPMMGACGRACKRNVRVSRTAHTALTCEAVPGPAWPRTKLTSTRLARAFRDAEQTETNAALRRRARRQGTYTPAGWAALVEFCGHVCLACGARDRELTRDHIVPLSRGGPDDLDNLQPLCQICNTRKRVQDWGDMRPAGWREFLQAEVQL
jgi:5-methylcytosine-specific restriction endonuclease McrA